MKIRRSILCRAAQLALLLALAGMVSAANLWAQVQTDQCSAPTIGQGTGAVGNANGTATCGIVITVSAGGSATIAMPGNGNGNPYDGSEDTLVGIQNNSGATLSSITLSATGVDIFGFDGDGPCDTLYHSPAYSWCPEGYPTIAGDTNPAGYAGPDNTFTNISGDMTSGTVNFTTPIPNGGSTWFALEGAPSSISGVTVSYALTLTELGLGAGNVTDTTNTSSPPPTPINCTEAGGGVPQTGICSETDAGGTMVTLTETPGTTTGGLSTFGGWGGTCASFGTSPTCTLTMNSAQNVTASFVAPPVHYDFTVNPGTNVTETALLCHGVPVFPPNACSDDPNASQLTITIPKVVTEFALTAVITEFSDNGLCPPEGTVTSNFACRFRGFFNYGTDPNGNTVAPLCYDYLNGNCAHYLLYSGSPGTVPPPADYIGDFYLDIGFANTSASSNLSSFWANNKAPRMLDDPDSDEFSGVPYGTDCSTAMLVNNGQPYTPTSFCQFDEDITTFFTPGPGLDPIGGKIPATNNIVVAFIPTTTGSNPVQTPPTSTAPALTGSCVNGCVLSGGSITFTEGTGGTFQVSITAGFPAPSLTESGPLPSGLTFNPATGTVGGTPAEGTQGSYPITFTATNTAGSAVLSYTLTVSKAPLTITASSATMTYGGTVPTITPTLTGALNGDNAMTLGVTCTTTATSTSLPGSYPSSCSASNGTNYAITYVSGTVTVVGLDISRLTVDFGQLYLGQLGVQFVTLKNTTTAPITITSMTLGGGSANGDYGDLALCPPMILKLPATLPAGKSCAIGVGILATAKVFSPAASTTYLTITDSAATQQVLLTAQVIDPLVSLSSTNLNFGSQKTGTTSTPPKKVTLTNSGLTTLTLTGLTISGNFAFAPTTTCTSNSSLSPGGTCAIYVTFTPTSKGSKSGSVTITDLTLFGRQTISLSGTGN